MVGDLSESGVSSRSRSYPYEYTSSISTQGDSSPHSSPGDSFLIPRPPVIDVPSINEQSLSRRSLDAPSSQESTSDELLPQANILSVQIEQSLQMTPSQGFQYIKSAPDSPNHAQSYLDHNTFFSLPSTRTIPMLHSTHPSTSLYRDNEFLPKDVPGCNDTHIDGGPRNHYQERPPISSTNWSSNPSSPDSSQNEIGTITQDMSAVPGNFSSHFLGQNEVPPSSLAIDFPSMCPRCDSSDFTYQNVNLWLLHYWKEHPPPAGSFAAWRPRPCIWEGCGLRKSFKTHRSWIEHAHSVHYRRFWCTFDNCDVGKPFGSQNTLDRHLNTKHAEPIPCTRTGCQAKKNINLWRKDKLAKHEAKYHGPLICTVAGCPRGHVNGQDHGFSEPNDLDKHMKVKHRHLPNRNRSI
jgi:hypothetical protein